LQNRNHFTLVTKDEADYSQENTKGKKEEKREIIINHRHSKGMEGVVGLIGLKLSFVEFAAQIR